MIHSFRNVIKGFAAMLTPEEAITMEHKEGFVSARIERSLPLHTTYTPKFSPGVIPSEDIFHGTRTAGEAAGITDGDRPQNT
ncbi:Subtilisin-like protease [Linum perenne]